MSAPALTPAALRVHLPASFDPGTQVFAVRADGRFGERMFRAGEHVLVEGAAQEGDLVVLVARGRGRPRLGTVRSTGLVGDRGEPCSISRWAVAGRVVGIARPVGSGWGLERLDDPDLLGMVAEPPPRQQLSLFAA